MRDYGSVRQSSQHNVTTLVTLNDFTSAFSGANNGGFYWFSLGIQQWGVASTSSYWTTENKYPVSFNLATFAISLLPRDPNANYTYSDQVGLQKCTKTGFYGGLAHTIEPDNIFYIVVGI